MKKILACLIAGLLALSSLSACSGSQSTGDASKPDESQSQGGEEGVHTALAAVGHRDGDHLRLRLGRQKLLPEDGADLRRGHGAFEGVRDQDVSFHGVSSFQRRFMADRSAACVRIWFHVSL